MMTQHPLNTRDDDTNAGGVILTLERQDNARVVKLGFGNNSNTTRCMGNEGVAEEMREEDGECSGVILKRLM